MKKQILIGAGVLFGVTALQGQNRFEYGGAAFQFTYGAGTEGKIISLGGFSNQVVAGKPFSATEERHSLQVLGDGTRLENTESNRLYRDDQGRTRIERTGGAITIFDPVAGFTAELDPATKTASKANSPNLLFRAVNTDLAKLRAELAAMLTQRTEANPQVVKLKAQIAELEKATLFDLAKKQTTEAQAGGQPALSLTTVDGRAILSVSPGDNASVESLPAQMVNGALAQGTRTTETIPVGKIGNDRPIGIVHERWVSNDLQMMVKSTNSDPRFGDTTYQLTNIVQSAPDPSLFQIPADYTIRK